MKNRRLISILLILSFIFADFVIPVFADEAVTELDIRTESISISENGVYKIIGGGTETANTITIGQNVEATITIDNVNISAASGSAMAVQSGAMVSLYLSGDNTLNTSANLKAGLSVTKMAGVATEVKIYDSGEGTGTLTAQGGQNAAGIGSNASSSMMGSITINSGTVTGIGGSIAGAGIGSGYNGSESDGVITINGGIVKGQGNSSYSAGIGGGYSSKSFGSVIINGGYVTATGYTGIGSGKSGSITGLQINGGSVNAALSTTAVNQHGDDVQLIILQMPEGKNNTEVTVTNEYSETWSAFTDDEGKIYMFVSNNIDNAVVKDGDGVIYSAHIDLSDTSQIFSLSASEGEECICTNDNASISFTVSEQEEPYAVSVNKITGQSKVRLLTTFNKAENCTYPSHGSIPQYTIADKSGNEIQSDTAVVDNGYLTVYYEAAGTDLYVTAKVTNNGIEYTDTKVISVLADDKSRYNLNDGNIEIKDDSANPDMLSVTVGSTEYSASKTEPVYIYQSTADSTTSTITVYAKEVNVVLQSVNIHTTSTKPMDIRTGVNLTLTLEGDNYLQSTTQAGALTGVNDVNSSLTIDGDGSLSSISAVGAGIGGVGGTITINSGKIYAQGGNGGSGIGGGSDGAGKTVIINGGCVTAHGSENAAGIGGGSTISGIGGNVTINAGRVIADSDSGIGIGAGGGSKEGTITINGGSVKGSLGAAPTKTIDGEQKTLYLTEVSVEGVTGEHDVFYTIGDDETQKIATATDELGKLYLYLPLDKNWVRVYKDDTIYYKFFQVKKDTSNNKGTCMAHPVGEITRFTVPGQIGDTTIKTGEAINEISVVVPYNIILSKVNPHIEYKGAECNIVGGNDFSNTVVYEVMADDKSITKYEVNIKPENQPSETGPSVYDISEGSIYFTEDYVEYAGTAYSNNENGYIITGTTTENIILVDSAEDNTPVDITLRDLNITVPAYAAALQVYRNTNIKLEGDNSLQTLYETIEAVRVENLGDECVLNVSGEGSLSMTGAPNAPGILLSYATVNITSDKNINITGGAGAPSVLANDSDCKFITDTITNMHLSDDSNSSRMQAVDSNGENLYHTTIVLDGDIPENSSVLYKNKTYYLDSNNAFYRMLPAGEVSMDIMLGQTLYVGKTEIKEGDNQIIAYPIMVENVEYENAMTYEGGAAVFTFTGTLMEDVVKIKLVPEDETKETLEAAAVLGGDGKYRATVSVPANASPDSSVLYNVYYDIIIDENTSYEYSAGPQIIVAKNNTICRITGFTLPDQIGEAEIDDDYSTNQDEISVGRIVVYFPYDYDLSPGNYFPDISIIGKTVTSLNYYTKPSAASTAIEAEYEVTAYDLKTTHTYVASLRKQAAPAIETIAFTNPAASDGGKVYVKLSGTALAYIKNAYNENNRKVTISSDGLETAEAVEIQNESGDIYFEAELDVPENLSDTSAASYELIVKIGDTVQTLTNNNILTVPRKAKTVTSIKSFTIENQLGETEYDGDDIYITMPYDADITSISPRISLEDNRSVCNPLSAQDFTNPVKYTITAEDGITKREYIVHVTKQETPKAIGVEFENPATSAAGRVEVTVNGEYLENAANAINHTGDIVVSLTPSAGTMSGTAIKNDNGDFTAVVFIPQNDDYENTSEYEINIRIGGTEQELTGNKTITVPRKAHNQMEMLDFVLTENQIGAPVISGNNFTVYVPYNTDLSSIEPRVSHNGVDYTPKGEQNFNDTVDYEIIAENGLTQVYHVNVQRSGVAKIDSISYVAPKTFADINIDVDITGNFIPFLSDLDEENQKYKDELEISATANGDTTVGTIDYDGFSGKATGHLSVPKNMLTEDVIYTIDIKINGISQTLGYGKTFTVPARTTRTIELFRVNNQIGSTIIQEDNDDSGHIDFYMPYNTDLTALLPYVEIDGDSYKPTEAQNFEYPVTYTVSSDNDTDRTYTVKAMRSGLPTISSVLLNDKSNAFNFDTFIGGAVNVEVKGIFFYDMKVQAISSDGSETLDGTVTMNKWHEATAIIDIPTNYDTMEDKEYTLKFYLDNFEDEITYTSPVKITVPRRKTRAITNFIINNQAGVATITDTDVYIKVQYNTDISQLTPTLTIDGDSYTPVGKQNFDNETKSLVYTVAAADDEDRNYTVHISRDGKPTISKLTFMSPTNFKGGSVAVNFEGIFFENAEVYAVPLDGGAQISGTVTSFNDGKATAVVNLPENHDTEEEKIYKLKFVIDGMITSYLGGTEITVPRRTAREITEFALPDVQEGETKIEGTNIYINVPYHLDISSVTPEITYDADKITPEGAQDFSDTANPIKYTLSSSGDEDITYTVYITRIGKDPYLKGLTVENQVGDTEYDGDNISLTLKSNANLKEIEPVLEFEGADYSPKGPQDFTNSSKEPLVYNVVNEYGIEHKYYVSINKKKSSGGGSSGDVIPTSTPMPTSTPAVEPTPTSEPVIEPTTIPTAEPRIKPYINGYEEDGIWLFKPDNTITRAEVATILSVLNKDFDEDVQYPNTFADVGKNIWYANYVNFAVEKGYISGYEDNTCRPDNMITRAEFAAILARYIDISPIEGEDKFSDIGHLYWCRQQLNALADMGIISGYDSGIFLPDNHITRAEAVTMFNRALGREMTEEILTRITCPFDDITSSHWAYNDVLLASCEY